MSPRLVPDREMGRTGHVVPFLATLLLLAMTPGAEAMFRVEKATFKVNMPASIKGTYDMSIANFGSPIYGATLTGNLIYPSEDRDGCVPFPDGYKVPKNVGLGASILVIDRGECAFTKKAYHAQKAGADAVMVVDNIVESLVTMDAGDDEETVSYSRNISIPVGLIKKVVGAKIETVLEEGKKVLVMLNWTDVMPHPDNRVEWEFWTNSGDNCGAKCDSQKAFIRDFAPVATELEKNQYTQFTPHYLTWLCPPEYVNDPACKAQCINGGRYCCPDPDDDLEHGYSGRDVVVENLRSLCVFHQANRTGQSWMWWRYSIQFGDRCTMASGEYGREDCATSIITNLGLDIEQWRQCVGDPNANKTNTILEREQRQQVSSQERGDVTILPTVIINNRQYRGKLERSSVLKTICAGFKVGQEPELCADLGFINNKCAKDAEGFKACLSDAGGTGLTGCDVQNEWPYYKCVCPKGTNAVKKPDGQTVCEEINECSRVTIDMPSCSCDRCVCKDLPEGEFECQEIVASKCDAGGANPGGCWADGGFSACVDNIEAKKAAGVAGRDPNSEPDVVCKCPKGFEGNGYKCDDVDECETRCKGNQQVCANTVGSYTCDCEDGFEKILFGTDPEPDAFKCMPRASEAAPASGSAGHNFGIILGSAITSVVLLSAGGFLLYRWRLRNYMDQEIRAIMSQYMPLEDENGEGAGGRGGGSQRIATGDDELEMDNTV